MSAPTGQLPDEAPAQERAERRNNKENARRAGLVVLAVIITLFAVLNVDEVKVHWIVGSGRAPLIIVIVISLLAGIVLSYFAERLSRRRH